MQKKKVAVFSSISWGFRELSHHLALLLPLSALFFAPEISAKFHWGWPILLREIFKTAFFFFVLLRAMALTKPKGQSVPRGNAATFAQGELLKILAQGTALALGALILMLWLTWKDPDLLASILNIKFSEKSGLELYKLWESRPWWDRMGLVVILAWLPLRVHVLLNFFGYIVADQGGTAWAALTEAYRLAQGVQWQLLFFYALCLGINIIGFKLFIVGAIFTFPATVLATVYVYRQMASWEESKIT